MPNPLRGVDQAGDAIRNVIRAYHGSPYDFNKFDAAKIGTGEGAQAYGHGLYFAGNEGTADFYRRKLSEAGDEPAKWARDFWEAQSQPDAIGSPEKAYDYLLGHIRSIRNAGPGSAYSPGLKSHYAAAEKYLLSQDPRVVPSPIRQGRMYEVEIAHPEHALLDLDAPIGQQPERVMDFLQSRKFEETPLTGRDLIRDLQYELAGKYTTRPHKDMERLAGQEASQALMEAGVPGIRFLDQGSRGTGQGTHNYVMFPGTEDQIRILRKYGLMAPIAAGAAAGAGEQPAP